MPGSAAMLRSSAGPENRRCPLATRARRLRYAHARPAAGRDGAPRPIRRLPQRSSTRVKPIPEHGAAESKNIPNSRRYEYQVNGAANRERFDDKYRFQKMHPEDEIDYRLSPTGRNDH